VTRSAELSEAAWARIEPLMPQAEGRSRRWRDLPERFGPWQTVWKRHHRFATDGTWDMLRVIQSEADAAGRVDWSASVDSSIVRAHQHSATARRVVREDRAGREEHIGARLNDKNSRCAGTNRAITLSRRAAASRGGCPSAEDDNRKGKYPLLSISNLYRTGGLAASPGSCRIIAGRSARTYGMGVTKCGCC
jgi:transposase